MENNPLNHSLQINLQSLRRKFGESPDIIVREFNLQEGMKSFELAVVYIDGLVDKKTVNEFLLQKANEMRSLSGKQCFDYIKEAIGAIGEVKIISEENDLLQGMLSGYTIVMLDGSSEAIQVSTSGGEKRGVEEPKAQVVIRGPSDSFNETLSTNIALIRRRIKSADLWMESMQIGNVTQTEVAIMYVHGIVNEKLVKEVKSRLGKIDLDAILESGYVEQMIQDQPSSLFPTIYNTERPDVVAGNLLEGRIAILVDSTPFVLLVPTVFVQFFQSVEDYYQRYDIANFLRLLRYISFFISLLGPSIYIAAITFHQEMIPTTLLISLAASREGVPFPTIIETLLMEFSFEILREAGIRMPRAIGQAVSIVGALVLGQAAVQAGIVSPVTVIVVAITGIASFSTPAFNFAITVRLLRFILMIAAAVFGFYGMAIIMLIIVGHMAGLRSFGIPYLSPFAPFIPEDQKDAVLRFPLSWMSERQRLINQNKTMRTHQKRQRGSK